MPKTTSLCKSLSIGALITLGLLASSADAFYSPRASPPSPPRRLLLLAAKEPLVLTSNPTPAQIANLAAEPSHDESKSGTWSESIPAGETYTRFVVEGEGSVTLTSSDGETARRRIGPGSLVEVTGAGGGSQLVWDVDDEMKILYSGEWFDEQQKVALGLLVGLGTVAGAYYMSTGV